MNTHWVFHPELTDCTLENRLVPAVSNLGVIVLTTGGYTLVTPFPGASGLAASTGPGGMLANPCFFVSGSGGISSAQPGNMTGLPSGNAPTSTTPANTNGSVTINVGSGATSVLSLTTVNSVSRNTIANDALPPRPLIGGQPSGDHSPILPPGQTYRGTPAATPPPTAEVPTPPQQPSDAPSPRAVVASK
jgi:hypothetical protein